MFNAFSEIILRENTDKVFSAYAYGRSSGYCVPGNRLIGVSTGTVLAQAAVIARFIESQRLDAISVSYSEERFTVLLDMDFAEYKQLFRDSEVHTIATKDGALVHDVLILIPMVNMPVCRFRCVEFTH